MLKLGIGNHDAGEHIHADEIRPKTWRKEALSKNGLGYPFPQYGIQHDVRAGMAVSYSERKN